MTSWVEPRYCPLEWCRMPVLTALLAFTVLMLATASPARAAPDGLDILEGLLEQNKPIVCADQTYALCAGSKCTVFNDVAYCDCKVLKGNSVSSPFKYAGGDVCTVNAAGPKAGYMVSTFSLPKSLLAPSGNQAVYSCPRATTFAAYAKCDGGICFTNTVKDPTSESGTIQRIVCSCPVERANPIQGLEIIGPYPCEQAFFRNCDAAYATNATASTLYDGTSLFGTEIGTRTLYGSVPPLNKCPPR